MIIHKSSAAIGSEVANVERMANRNLVSIEKFQQQLGKEIRDLPLSLFEGILLRIKTAALTASGQKPLVNLDWSSIFLATLMTSLLDASPFPLESELWRYFNPLDTLFLCPVFALDKRLAPVNVDSLGLLSSPSFDIG